MRFSEKVLDIVTVNLLTSLVCPSTGVAEISLYRDYVWIKRSRRVPVFRIYLKSFQAKSNWVSSWFAGVGHSFASLLDLSLLGRTGLPLCESYRLGILIFLPLVMLVVIPSLPPMIYWKSAAEGLILAEVLTSMVLPHVSYSLSHCDGSLSIRIHSSLGGSAILFGLVCYSFSNGLMERNCFRNTSRMVCFWNYFNR